ncbi:MAG: glycosidase [Desulfurococcaceae archaeon]
MNCRSRFQVSSGGVEACSKRLFDTIDIVTRIGAITPDRVFIRNHPISSPSAIFNPTMFLCDNDILKIYARATFGSSTYTSFIIELEIPIDDLITGSFVENKYVGNIVLYPDNRYDIWGVEDPRLTIIENKQYMTYIGRRVNYFNNIVKKYRTMPLTAIYDNENKTWIKKYVYSLNNIIADEVVCVKDSFLYNYVDNYYLFYRLHLIDDTYSPVYSSIDRESMIDNETVLKQIVLNNIQCVLPIPSFEHKIGWSTQPLLINESRERFISILYGVDQYSYTYRLFAVELSIEDREVNVEAITPRYIMEPRPLYEIIGDKPFKIMACGIVRIDRENLLLSYGAGDNIIAFGLIDYNELMSELDRGRIY